MRFVLPTLLLLGTLARPAIAVQYPQTDWQDGGGVSGPVTAWSRSFDSSAGVAAKSVPGQLALSSEPLVPGSKHLISDAFVRSFGVFATDMDRDGDTDVLGGAEGSRVVVLWSNNGASPPAWSAQVIDPAFVSAEAVWGGDLDGDGRKDVIATAKGTDPALAWWRNEGGNPATWTKHVIRQPWGNTYELCVGDLDRDGDLDILSTSCTSNEVAWWRNDGGVPLEWTFQVIGSNFGEAHSACFADFDGDCDNDVVAAGSTANEVAWWCQDAGTPPAWTKHLINGQFTGARSVRIGDIDGDGRVDVVGTCWDGRVAWWRNLGGTPPVWAEQLLDTQLSGGHSIALADLDGDGDLDVTAAGFTLHTVRWYENTGGDPVFWVIHPVDNLCRQAAEVATADVDGDGDLDILGTSYYDGAFNWWEVTTFRPNGELRSSILDLAAPPAAWRLSWNGLTPPGTRLLFRARGSDDPSDLGPWSADLASPGFLPITPSRYLQLALDLETDEPRTSPLVHELLVETWTDPAEIKDEPDTQEEGEGSGSLELGIPNPAAGVVRLNYGSRASGVAVIEIFDALGKLRWRTRNWVDSGERRAEAVNGLAPGRYFCCLSVDQRHTVRRFVVSS